MNNDINRLATILQRYLPLDEEERRLLQSFDSRCETRAARSIFWHAGDAVGQLYLIQEGWACTYRNNIDGMHQIMDLLLPGDIIGLRDFTFAFHNMEAMMITQGIVSPFSFRAIAQCVQASPRLSIALFAAVARQEALLTERMLINIHRSARSRLTHLIIESYLRLNKIDQAELEYFYFPLSQRMLGDILGITHVHINRTLVALEEEGIMKKHRRHVEVFDGKRLYEEAQFDDAYLSDKLDGLSEYMEPSQRREPMMAGGGGDLQHSR